MERCDVVGLQAASAAALPATPAVLLEGGAAGCRPPVAGRGESAHSRRYWVKCNCYKERSLDFTLTETVTGVWSIKDAEILGGT